jgi:hypothetical protein
MCFVKSQSQKLQVSLQQKCISKPLSPPPLSQIRRLSVPPIFKKRYERSCLLVLRYLYGPTGGPQDEVEYLLKHSCESGEHVISLMEIWTQPLEG